MTSTGTPGDRYDNAMAESFFATMECELIKRRAFQTQVEARMAIFEHLQVWCNTPSRNSALGYLSPNDFECATAMVPHLEDNAGRHDKTTQGSVPFGDSKIQNHRPGNPCHPIRVKTLLPQAIAHLSVDRSCCVQPHRILFTMECTPFAHRDRQGERIRTACVPATRVHQAAEGTVAVEVGTRLPTRLKLSRVTNASCSTSGSPNVNPGVRRTLTPILTALPIHSNHRAKTRGKPTFQVLNSVEAPHLPRTTIRQQCLQLQDLQGNRLRDEDWIYLPHHHPFFPAQPC